MIDIVECVETGRLEDVRRLFREYAAGLDIDLAFQGFEDESRRSSRQHEVLALIGKGGTGEVWHAPDLRAVDDERRAPAWHALGSVLSCIVRTAEGLLSGKPPPLPRTTARSTTAESSDRVVRRRRQE